MQMQMAKMIMDVAPRVLSWVWKGLNTVYTKLTTWYRDWQARRAPKPADDPNKSDDDNKSGGGNQSGDDNKPDTDEKPSKVVLSSDEDQPSDGGGNSGGSGGSGGSGESSGGESGGSGDDDDDEYDWEDMLEDDLPDVLVL